MKIVDINTHKDYILEDIECKLIIKGNIKNTNGLIEMVTNDKFKFIAEDEVYNFKIENDSIRLKLIDKLKQGFSNLCTIKNTNSEMFFIDIYFFPRSHNVGNIEIVVSDSLTKGLIEARAIKENEEYSKSLSDKFKLSDGRNDYFLLYVGEEKEEENNKEVEDKEQNKFSKIQQFIIYCDDFRIKVVVQKDGDKEVLVAEKIIKGKKQNIMPLSLAIGKISFVRESTFLSKKVKELLDEGSEYLDTWNEYSNKEGENLLERAREVNLISYSEITPNKKGGYDIKISDETVISKISANDSLSFSNDIPVYLENENMNWEEYKKYVNDLEKNRNFEERIVEKNVLIKSINNEKNIEVEFEGNIEETVYLYLNIKGNYSQIKRREDARDKISTGQCEMPTLGLILEGKCDDNRSLQLKKVKNSKTDALSSFVHKKVFKNEPTDTQVRAIDIALNTPDIAIIQGPPGTGKTTVITAVIERLNELFDKKESIRGQVLITSFQHDAVENVIQRLTVNALPTVKYGSRNKDTGYDIDKVIENWCFEATRKIKEQNIEISQIQDIKNLDKEYNFYEISPSVENARKFLEIAKKIIIDKDILDEINFILDEISPDEELDTQDITNKIMNIRVTKQGFLDDGIENILILCEALKNSNQDIVKKLKRFAVIEVTKESLKELKEIRRYLLEKIKPKPMYQTNKPREDILEIYPKIKKCIINPKDEKDEIIIGFLNEMENNINSVKSALQEYSFVFSASTQQSVGKNIADAKNKDMTYDTVIVDEAARANPGDLMIPLTMAKRRIILVGDHRQLPHIYDDEIVEKMQEDNENIDEKLKNIEKSMFEHLLGSVKELEKSDGIRRYITLDAQYRMHPLLGKFVSDNFYEEYGEAYGSPLGEEYFKQSLMKTPANWVDVGIEHGDKKKNGTSYIRDAEIRIIVDKIKEMITSEAGKDLTYGVISFYSAQVVEIRKALGSLKDRVRVGSVDAFQGMEFDVIFLSCVRTSKGLIGASKELTDKDAQKAFGFMKVPNRLCVSMSRQKKLLIVVGDSKLFIGKLGAKYVPAMKKYYELCQENGGVTNV